jgi:uncharacterized protein (TIGR03435 family)
VLPAERFKLGWIEAFDVPMPKLVELLSDNVGRTVIDKTGFAGTFNFQLDFVPDGTVGGPETVWRSFHLRGLAGTTGSATEAGERAGRSARD